MKKMISLLMLAPMLAFAQLEKIDTHEPIKKNIVEKNGSVLASAEIWSDYVEIVFYENTLGADLFFGLTPEEFRQVGNILQNYTVKDKDFYAIEISKGKLFIRFSERNGYVGSEIYMDFDNKIWHFPKMNRMQYNRLFDM